MANTGNSDKWYFTKEELEGTPSRKCGYDSYKELSYRQQAANFIQDMGQRLKVSQLCINTAIVYMHRFYVFHSFTHFPWHQMAAAALFLAAKVEEQPRKLEYVIRVANICRNPRDTSFDINSERYQAQSQDLVFNENVLLQTLGFDVAIDHPHTHVVRCCHLVRASKDLAQTSYFMASNSLHLTTMCIQYKPTVVACFCILVACKWSNWEIPLSNEKKEWYSYVDPTVTAELLQQLTEEFLVIFESCPSRLKEKIMAIDTTPSPHINSPFDQEPRKIIREDSKDSHPHKSSSSSSSSHDAVKSDDPHRHRSSRPHDASSSSQQQREREYREKKERERLAQQQKAMAGGSSSKPLSHGHHRPPVDPKLKQHSRPPSVSGYPPTGRVEPREILREAAKDSPFGLANKDYRDTREHAKDVSLREQTARSDKDIQKRDYLLKPNAAETNNFAESRLNYSADKQRIDAGRSRVDMSKVPSSKHDSVRRHEDGKPYLKSDADSIKKHLSVHDKTSAYLNKTNSTSLKKSSPTPDSSKSVPKPNMNQMGALPKSHHHNGSSSSSNGNAYNLPIIDSSSDKLKPDLNVVKEEVIKRPSLFSPEKHPAHKKYAVKSPKWPVDIMSFGKMASLPSPLMESPESRRSRHYSSSSEPELRPVMKKIDQVEGFENLMRDNTIGMNNLHQVPDIIAPIEDIKCKENSTLNFSKEMRPPDIIPPLGCDNNMALHTNLVNGIETNPTLISNLLKEAPAVSHLPAVAVNNNSSSSSALVAADQPETQSQLDGKDKDHHHHKSKKKNKEKHKHKDKSREDKEKKKKHKDKEREKHKHKQERLEVVEPLVAEPIKIKIHKDKIQPPAESSSQGIKIKIPKDKIKTEHIGEPSQSLQPPPQVSYGLKIKIPKDVINNCNADSSSGSSRKRERDRSSSGGGSSGDVPNKLSKSSYKESKQNGRHPYKVAQMGDGDTSLHRLADSKYINNKGSSS